MNREGNKHDDVPRSDEYNNEPRGGFDQGGTVDLVDESYIPFLSSLWQMPEIAREFAGPGSRLFKTFIRDLMKHLSKHTVGNDHPTMMIVYHGVLPSAENNFSPKEYLRIVSDKLDYSVWSLSDVSPHQVINMTRTAGADCWNKDLAIMVSDLVYPSFITNDGAVAIDALLMNIFTSLEAERTRIPRAFGSGLSSSSSASSIQPAGSGSQG